MTFTSFLAVIGSAITRCLKREFGGHRGPRHVWKSKKMFEVSKPANEIEFLGCLLKLQMCVRSNYAIFDHIALSFINRFNWPITFLDRLSYLNGCRSVA